MAYYDESTLSTMQVLDMAVLTVIVLWFIVSIMAALSLGRFFAIGGGQEPAPIRVRRRESLHADARRTALDQEQRAG